MKINLTQDGVDLLLHCLEGGPSPVFTAIVLGNGADAGGKVSEMSNPLVEIPISSMERAEGADFITLSGVVNNSHIETRFRATEAGVYVQNPDDESQRILFAYAHVPDDEATVIPSANDYAFQMTENVSVYVGSTKDVTAIIAEGISTVTKAEFSQHTKNTNNPHQVTKEQLGLGNVPNVSTNDQTPIFEEAKKLENIGSGENLSTIFGKIKFAISKLIAHLSDKNNPHSITAEKINAAEKSHTHSTVDINSGTLTPQRGGTGVSNPKAGGLLKTNGEKACESLIGVGALYSEESGKPTFNTLPISMGGTGVTSLESLSEQLSNSLIVVGEYTGNNQSYREISLGFYPRAVLLFDSNGRTSAKYRSAVEMPCVYYGGLALRGSPIIKTHNGTVCTVLSVTQNGFAVGYNDSSVGSTETMMVYTNRSDLSYRYIAIR